MPIDVPLLSIAWQDEVFALLRDEKVMLEDSPPKGWKLFKLIVAFTFSPILVTLLAGLLSELLSCEPAGELAVKNCYFPWMDKVISSLIPMAWLEFVTMPVGGVAFVILLIYWAFRRE